MFVILRKEYFDRVKKKTFILTTLLTPIAIILLTAAPAAMAMFSEDSAEDTYKIAVIDESNIIAKDLKDNIIVDFDIVSPAEAASIKEHKNDYDAILYLNENVTENNKNIVLESFGDITMKVEGEITGAINAVIKNIRIKNYNIDGLEQIVKDINVRSSLRTMTISETGESVSSSSGLNYAIGYIGGFLMYIFIFTYGSMILNSVIDEKSSKVVEVMVSTVSPMHMMLGKILGVGLVAITQFMIWGVFMFIGGTIMTTLFANQMIDPETMTAVSQGMPAASMGSDQMMPAELSMALSSISDLGFILKTFSLLTVFFIGGYLFYASCFAAIASAVDNIQDVQQLQMPITIPIIVSIVSLSSIINDPNGALATWLSLIPFTSPVIMMGRISSSIPTWEIVLSISILYASFVVMIWMASRIYRVGIFMHGKKPTYKELYKWIRYK